MIASSSPKTTGPRTDPDSALEALKRAEELAAATGPAIIQWENGRIVRFYPGREKESGSRPEP